MDERHGHPAINQALKTQLDAISHSTLLGQAGVGIVLAKRLSDLLARILIPVSP